MGEWKTVYEDEVEERWVTVKVYESEDDEDGDEGPAVRVTAAPIEDVEGELEQKGNVQTPVAEAEAADSSITLEPDPVEDLEGGTHRNRLQPRGGCLDRSQGS